MSQLLRRAVELLEEAKNACEAEGDFGGFPGPVDEDLAREIEEFLSKVTEVQEASDGLQSLSVDTKDFIAAAIRKALDRTDLSHLKFAVDGKDLAFEMQKALTAASERVVFEAIDATAVREDSNG